MGAEWSWQTLFILYFYLLSSTLLLQLCTLHVHNVSAGPSVCFKTAQLSSGCVIHKGLFTCPCSDPTDTCALPAGCCTFKLRFCINPSGIGSAFCFSIHFPSRIQLTFSIHWCSDRRVRQLLGEQEVQSRAADAARANVEAHYSWISTVMSAFMERWVGAFF